MGKEYEIFQKLLNGRKVILEIGCGTGRDAVELINRGFNYTGIDASEGMLKLAKQQVPMGTFLIGDFYNLDLQSNSFDAFWAVASFLHVPKTDISIVLQEARRILNHDGIGFIAMKEKTVMEEGVIEEAKVGGIQRFFAFYTQEEFSTILDTNGFKIIEKVIEIEKDPQAHKWLGFFVKKV